MENSTHLDPLEDQKIEKIKNLLSIPCAKRTDEVKIELATLTKNFKIFDCISTPTELQEICGAMTLVNCKPNDEIVRQGDPGEDLFYILHGIVNIKLSIQIDTGIKSTGDLSGGIIKIDKIIGVLKDGDSFGELSLFYKTPRSSSIVAVTDTSLIKIDKDIFNKFIKNTFENQIQDQIEFLQICPIFNNLNKSLLIKLGIRTVMQKYATGQIILETGRKYDYLYVIRRGSVKAVKTVKFIKNEQKIRKNRLKRNRSQILDFNGMNNRQQIEKEKILEILARGPTDEKDSVNKDITLEILKIGDIFPSYYSINYLELDVQFEADNPCELIKIKLSDIQEITPETYDFIKNYAKPYPNEEFIRRFHYYNESWLKYKKLVKDNILTDVLNKNVAKNKDLRTKLYNRKDLENIELPMIFNFKNKNMKFK